MEKIINKISKADEIKSLYKRNYEDLKKSSNFWKKTLNILNIDYYAENINNIPKTGSTIVVANHPFGLLDGLIICSIICDIRKDYKILINEEVSQIDQIREYLLPIKFSRLTSDIKKNIITKKKAIEHLNSNGILITFPSGEVATSSLIFNEANEREWKPLIGSIINKTNADIIPVRFFGKNSLFFHTIGFINNNLRRVLFIRELFNKKNKKFNLSIGKKITLLQKEKLNNKQMVQKLRSIVLNIN
ncbi:MAG: 1-acyl-sn-glycerol-3-phosphate acyltransferase [Candidatus Pelagibacter sp.]|tara:strand:- start:48 stop:785 length:738 start_codon:yes stop_codon:yes gene_type:complete